MNNLTISFWVGLLFVAAALFTVLGFLWGARWERRANTRWSVPTPTKSTAEIAEEKEEARLKWEDDKKDLAREIARSLESSFRISDSWYDGESDRLFPARTEDLEFHIEDVLDANKGKLS